jgi:transcriptional regulator with XRE-family HTH domain
MSKAPKEDLSRYVERVMSEKRLSRADVKKRSGGKIAESYVSGIIKGTATNLSIEKLKALARGLRVSEKQLVRVAFGPSNERAVSGSVDRTHNLILVDITNKHLLGTDIAEIVQWVITLSAEDREVVLRYVKKLAKEERKARPKAHRKRRSS